MIDDVHDLTAAQRRLLVDDYIKNRRTQGIWLAERLQALRTPEILSQGSNSRPRLPGYIRIEQAWSTHQKVFEAFLIGIADRRVTQADDMHLTKFHAPAFQRPAAHSRGIRASPGIDCGIEGSV